MCAHAWEKLMGKYNGKYVPQVKLIGLCMAVCVCVQRTKFHIYNTCIPCTNLEWPIPENEHYFISAVYSVLVFSFIYPHPHLPIFTVCFALLTKLTLSYADIYLVYGYGWVYVCVREREERGKYGKHYPDRCIHIQKLLELVQPILLLLALAIYITALRRFFSPILLCIRIRVLFLVVQCVVRFELV